MGQVLTGTGTSWDRYSLGLGHHGTGTQWDWDIMGQVLTGTGTQRDCDTTGPDSGTGTQRDWHTVGLGHNNGTGTQWDWDTGGRAPEPLVVTGSTVVFQTQDASLKADFACSFPFVTSVYIPNMT